MKKKRPKEIEIFVKLANETTDVDEFISKIRQIKNIPFTASEWFFREYAPNGEDIGKAAWAFMKEVNPKVMKVKINEEQNLYVLPLECGGFSCLGFEVCRNQDTSLRQELGIPITKHKPGTYKAYDSYIESQEIARKRNAATGFRSKTQLTPQLIGLEGSRVEVRDSYGESRRFTVGKSTGFIPCHLELSNCRSDGGCSVTGAPFKSLKVIIRKGEEALNYMF